MNKAVLFLFTTAVLTTGVGLPAWSAIHRASGDAMKPLEAVAGWIDSGARLILVDDDDNEGEAVKSDGYAAKSGEHEDGENCDEDEGSCGSARNPAAAGTVAPPKNGLFGDGAPPAANVQ